MTANRNGFFYVLDRTTGRVILARPFVTTTWAKEIGRDGRPVLVPGNTPDTKGSVTCPDPLGGTNFMPPSFDPARRLFFVTARETCAAWTYTKPEEPIALGERVPSGGAKGFPDGAQQYSALRAIDPVTGTMRWEHRFRNYPSA